MPRLIQCCAQVRDAQAFSGDQLAQDNEALEKAKRTTSLAAEKADLAEAERVWPPWRRHRPQARTVVLEASVESFANKVKALAHATQVLQSETGGADGQTYSARLAHLRFLKFGTGAGEDPFR